MAILSWFRRSLGFKPEQTPAVAVRPVEAPIAATSPIVSVRPTRTESAALVRNLERVRHLRTAIMGKLLAWRAEPFVAWLEQLPTFRRGNGADKRLARWCDVPTAVLIQSFANLLDLKLGVEPSGTLKFNSFGVDALAKHAATQPGDAAVRKWTIEHLSELVERERLLGANLGRIETDTEMIAALRAQHRLRKAHRDVLKNAIGRGQPLVAVPDRPRRRMPSGLTLEQQVYLDAHFARRNELLGVK